MLTTSVSSLEFGLVHYAPDLPPSLKQFTVHNESTSTIRICGVIRNTSAKDFPAIIKVLDVSAGFDFDDEAFLQMAADLPQEEISIGPKQTKQLLAIFSPLFLDRNPKTSARTSFVNISTDIDFIYRQESESSIVDDRGDTFLRISVSATLCTSILFVDDGEIEFINCLVGNTYVRDIQIWNRSECSLSFRIADEKLITSAASSNLQITFQEFDTGRLLPFARAIHIAAFASKRVRVSFRAEALGESTLSYRLENLNNPSNAATITVRINVIAKEESEAIALELDSGEAVDASQVLELGDCYCGLVLIKKLWMRNNSTDTIVMSVSSDQPTEVTFDLTGHADETKHSTVASATAKAIAAAAPTAPVTQSSAIATGIAAVRGGSNSGDTTALDDDDDDDDESAGPDGRTRSRSGGHGSTGNADQMKAVTGGRGGGGSTKNRTDGHTRTNRHNKGDGGSAGLHRSMTNEFDNENDDDDDVGNESGLSVSVITDITTSGRTGLQPGGGGLNTKSSKYSTLQPSSTSSNVWGASRNGISLLVDIGRMGAFGSSGCTDDIYDDWEYSSRDMKEQRWFIGATRPITSWLEAAEGGRKVAGKRVIEWNPALSSTRGRVLGMEQTPTRQFRSSSTETSAFLGVPGSSSGGAVMAGMSSSMSSSAEQKQSEMLMLSADHQSDMLSSDHRKAEQTVIILEPGSRKPITLFFCPRAAETDTDRRLLGSNQAAVQMLAMQSGGGSGGGHHGNSDSAGGLAVTEAAAAVDLGALSTRTVKVFIKWRLKGRSTSTTAEDDHHSYGAHDETEAYDLTRPSSVSFRRRSSLDEFMFRSSGGGAGGAGGGVDGANTQRDEPFHTRLVVCKGRACLSMISVTPSVNDLGECSVGDFRSAHFSVNNDSDLPAFIVPHVESETLSVVLKDREVRIPPRQQRQIQLDYVARLENTDYKRSFQVINAFNPTGNATVEVRAKNVDTHQVLAHSMFYKVLTYNTKRQLQVYYEKCLFNVPNLRVVSIRNIYDKPLVLQLYPLEGCSDIKIYLIRPAADEGGKDPSSDEMSGKTRDPSKDRSTQASRMFNLSQAIKNESIEDLKWGSPLGQQASMARNVAAYAQYEADKAFRSAVSYGDLHVPLSLAGDVATAAGAIDDSQLQLQTAINSLSTEGAIDVGELASSVAMHDSRRGRDRGEHVPEKSVSKLAGRVVEIEEQQQKIDYVSQFDQWGFPFSLLLPQANKSGSTKEGLSMSMEEALQDHSAASVAAAIRKGTGNSGVLAANSPTTEEIDNSDLNAIRLIQRCYRGLKAMLDDKTELIPLETDEQVGDAGMDIDGDDGDDGPNSATGLIVNDDCQTDKNGGTISAGGDGAEEGKKWKSITIPVGMTENFAVVFNPKAERTDDELNEVIFSRYIQLRLLSVTAADIVQHDSSSSTEGAKLASRHANGEPLKPRSVLIRGKIVLSEMSISQKNINFGRVVVGESVSRAVTIVNKSSVPCIFSISKSGSISSGFLRIPGGRKGKIDPFSSQTIDFVFKPTLPGIFEEALQVENVIDPTNTQSIIVKSKVSKPESFQLLAYPRESTTAAVKAVSSMSKLQSIDDEGGKSLSLTTTSTAAAAVSVKEASDPSTTTRARLNSTDVGSAQEIVMKEFLEKILSQQDVIEGTSVAPKFLGDIAVGEQCETVISFRIKNMTTKSRQFIVDASHADAVTLLPEFLSSRPGRTGSSDDATSLRDRAGSSSLGVAAAAAGAGGGGGGGGGDDNIHSSLSPIPFEPIPETLQSVVSVRCRFERYNLDDLEPRSTLSPADEKALGDKLEFFQQKLKIARRKNKPDKIAKYEKKLFETMRSLGQDVSGFQWTDGVGPSETNGKDDEGEDSDEGKDKEKSKEKKKDKQEKEKKNKEKDKDSDQQQQDKSSSSTEEQFSPAEGAAAAPEADETKVPKLSPSEEPKLEDVSVLIPAPVPVSKGDLSAAAGASSAATVSDTPPAVIVSRTTSQSQITGTVSEGSDTSAAVKVDTSTAGSSAGAGSSGSVMPIVGESDIAFHFIVGPEQEVVVQVRVRFLPGVSYKHWSGGLPFRGYFRVFECRNEDVVKTVHFGAMVYPSRHSMLVALHSDSDLRQPHTELSGDNTSPGASSSQIKSSLGFSLDDALNSRIDNTFDMVRYGIDLSGRTTPGMSVPSPLAITSTSGALNTNASNVFIATVAQWSSCPTKQLISRYRQSQFDILGVSLKLVQASKDGAMRGSLSVTSLIGLPASVRISVTEDFNAVVASAPVTESLVSYVPYIPGQHGPIHFSTTSHSSSYPSSVIAPKHHDLDPSHPSAGSSRGDQNQASTAATIGDRPPQLKSENSELVLSGPGRTTSSSTSSSTSSGVFHTDIPAGGKAEITVQWQPSAEMRQKCLMIGFIGIKVEFIEPGVSTASMLKKPITWSCLQIVPVVSFPEHKSNFKVDKYLNLGEVPLGTVKRAAVTLTSISDTDDFHYVTMLVDAAAAARSVGKVDISQGHTGVIVAQSSKDIVMDFSATSVGKFEQELWISNLNDRFDQKRVAVLANVILAQSQFVYFPDLEYEKATGKLEHLNFGLIQIQSQGHLAGTGISGGYRAGHMYSPSSALSIQSVATNQQQQNRSSTAHVGSSSSGVSSVVFSLPVGPAFTGNDQVRISTEEISDASNNGKLRNDFCYRLRVLNVSEKLLTVTAVSNLKSQCFLYADPECTTAIVSCPVSKSVAMPTVLYVVVRPTPFSGDQWSGGSSSGAGGGSQLGPGARTLAAMSSTTPGTSASTASGGSGGGGGPSAAKVAERAERAALAGRELVGGIRLVFFDVGRKEDLSGRTVPSSITVSGVSESPKPIDLLTSPTVAPRKLFETTVVFKAIVGYSLLRVKTPLEQPHYVNYAEPHMILANALAVIDSSMLSKELVNSVHIDSSSNSQLHSQEKQRTTEIPKTLQTFSQKVLVLKDGKLGVVFGQIVLENASPTFSLRYRYLKGHFGCICPVSGRSTIDVINEVAENFDRGTLPLKPSSHNSVHGWSPAEIAQTQSLTPPGTAGPGGPGVSASETQVIFFDTPESVLEAGYSAVVSYGIFFPLSLSGYATHNVEILNESTNDVQVFSLSVLFDDGRLRLKKAFTISGAAAPVTVKARSRSQSISSQGSAPHPPPLSRPSSLVVGSDATTATATTIATDISPHIEINAAKPAFSSGILSIASKFPIWAMATTLGDHGSLAPPASMQAAGTLRLPSRSAHRRYDVIGAARTILCSWVVVNTTNQPLSVSPLSNLPVFVKLKVILTVNAPILDQHPSDTTLASSSSRTSPLTTASASALVRSSHHTSAAAAGSSGSAGGGHRSRKPSNSTSYPSLLSATSAEWKGGLRKCGDPITIPPGASIAVRVICHSTQTLSLSTSSLGDPEEVSRRPSVSGTGTPTVTDALSRVLSASTAGGGGGGGGGGGLTAADWSDSGTIRRVEGVVALVPSNLVVSSFFDPANLRKFTAGGATREESDPSSHISRSSGLSAIEKSSSTSLLSVFDRPDGFSARDHTTTVASASSISLPPLSRISADNNSSSYQGSRSDTDTTTTGKQQQQQQQQPPGNSSFIPLVSFTKVVCDFVVPRVIVPVTTFSLGSLRCGRTSSFVVVVDSLCDVAVPVRLESLPSWMDVYIPVKQESSSLRPSAMGPPSIKTGKSYEVKGGGGDILSHQRGDSLSLSEVSNFGGDAASTAGAFWTFDLDDEDPNDLSENDDDNDDDDGDEDNAPDDTEESSAHGQGKGEVGRGGRGRGSGGGSLNVSVKSSSGRAENSLGAQKLRKWLETQSTKKSLSKSAAGRTGEFISVTKSDIQIHTLTAAAGGKNDGSGDDDENGDGRGEGRGREGGREGGEGEGDSESDDELVRLSLEVAPDGSLDEEGEDIPSILQSRPKNALYSSVSPVLAVPPRGKLSIRIRVKAPIVGSQTLEHSVVLRNLAATISIPRSTGSTHGHKGSMSRSLNGFGEVIDESSETSSHRSPFYFSSAAKSNLPETFELKVRLDVDSSVALGLTKSSGESLPHYTPLDEEANNAAEDDHDATHSNSSSNSASTAVKGKQMYVELGENIIVPPIPVAPTSSSASSSSAATAAPVTTTTAAVTAATAATAAVPKLLPTASVAPTLSKRSITSDTGSQPTGDAESSQEVTATAPKPALAAATATAAAGVQSSTATSTGTVTVTTAAQSATGSATGSKKPSRLNGTGTVRVCVKNMLSEGMKVLASFEPRAQLSDLVQLKFYYHGGGSIQDRTFDLMSGESADLRLVATSTPDSRIDPEVAERLSKQFVSLKDAAPTSKRTPSTSLTRDSSSSASASASSSSGAEADNSDKDKTQTLVKDSQSSSEAKSSSASASQNTRSTAVITSEATTGGEASTKSQNSSPSLSSSPSSSSLNSRFGPLVLGTVRFSPRTNAMARMRSDRGQRVGTPSGLTPDAVLTSESLPVTGGGGSGDVASAAPNTAAVVESSQAKKEEESKDEIGQDSAAHSLRRQSKSLRGGPRGVDPQLLPSTAGAPLESFVGFWDDDSAGVEGSGSSSLEQDAVYFDVVGYLFAGPTATAVAAVALEVVVRSPTLDADTEREKEKEKEQERERELSPSDCMSEDSASPSIPVAAVTANHISSSADEGSTGELDSSTYRFQNEIVFHATPQHVGDTVLSSSSVSSMTRAPILILKESHGILVLNNPSATRPFRFHIVSQSHRHPGMRLIVGGNTATVSTSTASGANAGSSSSATAAVNDDADNSEAESTTSGSVCGSVCGNVSGSVSGSGAVGSESELSKGIAFRSSTEVDRTRKPTVHIRRGISSEQQAQQNQGMYDTVMPVASPQTGVISPGASMQLMVYLGPGSSAGSPRPPISSSGSSSGSASTIPSPDAFECPDGQTLVATLPLEIWDDDNPHHMPTVIQTVLLSDVALPVLLTQPVSETNRNKYHLDSVVRGGSSQDQEEQHRDRDRDRDRDRRMKGGDTRSASSEAASDSLGLAPRGGAGRGGGGVETGTNLSKGGSRKGPPGSTSNSLHTNDHGSVTKYAVGGTGVLDSSVRDATVRLRGVTPCPSSFGQFEIQLGQQLHRPESLEWLLTLENRSDDLPLSYSISSMASNDESWILLGQTRGNIEPNGSSSVMLYFSRENIGVFATYLVVENLTNKSDIQVVRVSMEVVQDVKRRVLGSDGRPMPVKPLFQVITAEMRWLRHRDKHSDHPPAGRENEPLTVDYGDVYVGRQYRRRSILLENLSDSLHLDFQISSSLGPEQMTFTLSPLSLKPCTLITLAPREVRPVYFVFRPYSDTSTTATDNSNHNQQSISFSRGCSLRAEVYVACRLVRDHQETIRIKAHCRAPSIRVSLELPPRAQRRARRKSKTPLVIESIFSERRVADMGSLVQLASEMNVDIGSNVPTSLAERPSTSTKASTPQRGISQQPAPSASTTQQQWQPPSWLRADHGSHWRDAEYVCVRNKDKEEPMEVTIYCIMRLFCVRITDVLDRNGCRSDVGHNTLPPSALDDSLEISMSTDQQSDEESTSATSPTGSSPLARSVLLGPSVAHVCIPPGGSVWLHVEPTPAALSLLSGSRQRTSAQDMSSGGSEFSSAAEDSPRLPSVTALPEFAEEEEHFTVYRKYNLTERYRIPVRLNPFYFNRPANSPRSTRGSDLSEKGTAASSISSGIKEVGDTTADVGISVGGALTDEFTPPTVHTQQEGLVPALSEKESQPVLATFSSFEAAIATFLRQYYAVWADIIEFADVIPSHLLSAKFFTDNNDDSSGQPLRASDSRFASSDNLEAMSMSAPLAQAPSLYHSGGSLSTLGTPQKLSRKDSLSPMKSPPFYLSPGVISPSPSHSTQEEGAGAISPSASLPHTPSKDKDRDSTPFQGIKYLDDAGTMHIGATPHLVHHATKIAKLRAVIEFLVRNGHLVLTDGAIFSPSLSLSSTIPRSDGEPGAYHHHHNRGYADDNRSKMRVSQKLDCSLGQVDDMSDAASVASTVDNMPDTRSRSMSNGDIIGVSSVQGGGGSGADAGDVSFSEPVVAARDSQVDQLAASIGASLAETFFHFFALTDQLTLHSLKQAIIEGQPASRLALLLYTVVFRHPVFAGFNHKQPLESAVSASATAATLIRDTQDENSRSSSSVEVGLMPRILVPFSKQLLYYLGFFPEVSISMEPLVEVSEWLRASVLAYERRSW